MGEEIMAMKKEDSYWKDGDTRYKYTIDPGVLELISQIGPQNIVPGVSVTQLYKYIKGDQKYIMTGAAGKLARSLGAIPKFNHKDRTFTIAFTEFSQRKFKGSPKQFMNSIIKGMKGTREVPLTDIMALQTGEWLSPEPTPPSPNYCFNCGNKLGDNNVPLNEDSI